MKRFVAVLVLAVAVATAAPSALGGGHVLSISPRHLNFGKQAFDTVTTGTITLTNTSSEPVLVAFIGGVLPDDFNPGQLESTCPLPEQTLLEAGASCTQVVTFYPSAVFAGHEKGTLIVVALDPTTGAIIDRQTIRISGTGVEP